jgi:rubrerythrin
MKPKIFNELKESVKEGGRWFKKNVPMIEHPLICSVCGEESGYTIEGIMFLMVTTDLTCHNCGAVVVPAKNIFC